MFNLLPCTSSLTFAAFDRERKRMTGVLLFSLLAGAVAIVAPRPCDIYSSANTPCVAAHSTTRALYKDYSKALYQLKRSDGAVKDVDVTVPDLDAMSHMSSLTPALIGRTSLWTMLDTRTLWVKRRSASVTQLA